ncbi:MAG TPA: hypothetical protein VHC22_08240 [Pirellulales bacterium]|nr:hypothetical protein [Pirellulales bacterium]
MNPQTRDDDRILAARHTWKQTTSPIAMGGLTARISAWRPSPVIRGRGSRKSG